MKVKCDVVFVILKVKMRNKWNRIWVKSMMIAIVVKCVPNTLKLNSHLSITKNSYTMNIIT